MSRIRLGITLLLIGIASGTGAAGQPPGKKTAAPALPAGVQVTRDVQYVDDNNPKHRLDLYLPSPRPGNAPRPPLVVWIHGGGWRQGSKDRPPVAGLLEQGLAAASINYRFSSEATYPAQIHDCKAAIRFLRANAANTVTMPTGSACGGPPRVGISSPCSAPRRT